jgi:crossover junction endodeoxyribonuclease RuvC
MVILGLDPGTATTGFGVIEFKNNNFRLLDYGCITTAKIHSLPERLSQISIDLKEIIDTWKPDAIAIEEIFFSKNIKTAMSVAHARGALMQKLSSEGYSIFEYKPQQIKESVCGYGKAEKIQVQKMVQILLQMDVLPKPDDAADALAIAMCHAGTVRFRSLTGEENKVMTPLS